MDTKLRDEMLAEIKERNPAALTCFHTLSDSGWPRWREPTDKEVLELYTNKYDLLEWTQEYSRYRSELVKWLFRPYLPKPERPGIPDLYYKAKGLLMSPDNPDTGESLCRQVIDLKLTLLESGVKNEYYEIRLNNPASTLERLVLKADNLGQQVDAIQNSFKPDSRLN
ncbi:hypothetical protein [Arsenicibacter rosenii]|uniref:Uncharacterized protein n=1 Tax=Arsenicibacter rosenii TaxID=1750698 RepID=A0A1S2VLM9_9BACT|nr:hypothetical protein [Arsenicibacter rosenii]OIN59106.1 hypothetical protein BLX24_12945 [Arsenicibacter rosenii]